MRQLREGAAYVAGEPRLRAIALVGFGTNFVITGHTSLILLYATRHDVAASAVGLMLSISAVAGALGAIFAPRLLARTSPGRLYAITFSLVLSAPVLIPLAGGPNLLFLVVLGVAYSASFLAMGIGNVVVMSLRQRITPPALLGRMNAAMRTLLFGGGALGGVLTGGLAEIIGLRTGLAVLAGLSLLMVPPMLMSSVTQLRELPGSAEPVTAP
jgi:MFS family permease